MSKKILVSIIIVGDNHLPYLISCFNSIAQYQKNCEIWFVDNASKDNSVIYVKKHFPFVKIIQNKEKKGFAANNNSAIKRAKGKYIWLLNPDTIVWQKSLEKLVAFMEQNPQVGVCGPKLVFPNGKLQLSCRRFPTFQTTIVRRSPFRFFFEQSEINKQHLLFYESHTKPQPADWLLGACLFIRKKLIKKIGLLDEHFFLYVEDIDFCLRTWQKKWEVWYVPTATVTHVHQAESDRFFFSKKTYYHYKSMLYFFWKHVLRRAFL